MDFAAGKTPDEPCLHGAEQQLSGFRLMPGTGHIFQDPADLGAGEIRVDDKTGLMPDGLRQPLIPQRVAVGGGAAALPDDGGADGSAGLFAPDDGSLPLVGDADGGNVGRGSACVFQSLPGNFQLGSEDLVRVMLHPAGLGEVLGEFLLGHGADGARVVKEDAPVAGGACIQCHNVFCHAVTLLCIDIKNIPHSSGKLNIREDEKFWESREKTPAA